MKLVITSYSSGNTWESMEQPSGGQRLALGVQRREGGGEPQRPTQGSFSGRVQVSSGLWENRIRNL